MERGPVQRIAAVRGANAWLVPADGGLVLVDAGLPGSAAAILEHLARTGSAPGDLRAIVLTHADPDHAGGAAELHALTGAPVAIHADDAAVLAGGLTPRRAKGRLRAATLLPRIARLGHEVGMALALRLAPRRSGWRPLRADVLLRDGDGVAGLRVIHVPGHTAGSIALLRDDGALLAGDAVFGDAAGRAHYPPRRTALDPAAARASALRLMTSGFSTLFPGHGLPVRGRDPG